MGKEYDGIHRISFLINEQGTIEVTVHPSPIDSRM